MGRACLIFCAALALTSCSARTDSMLRQGFNYECNASESWVGDFLCSGNDGTEGRISRYCYNTLGGVDCYDRPDPDRNSQPMGSTGY